jgi:hypothetical protein
MDGLEDLKESIEHLAVDYQPTRQLYRFPDLLGFVGSVRTLNDFTNLRYLEVLQRVLLDGTYGNQSLKITDVFPPSLEGLTVIGPDEKLIPWLEDLLSCLETFPCFQRLGLSCRYQWGKRATWFHNPHLVLEKLRLSGIVVEITQRNDEDVYPRCQSSGEPDLRVGSWSDVNWATVLFGEDSLDT